MAKHRANGDGTIWEDTALKRFQGKLLLPNGKRKSVYGKTKREVQQKLAHLRREVEAGLHGTTSGEQSFLAFAQGWYDLHRTLEPNTLRNYRVILRNHFDDIGQVPLSKLKPELIQQHYARKLATRAPYTVHQIHEFFHVVLENAVKLEILPRNPTDHVDAPPAKPKEFQPLSDAQVQTLIASLDDHPLGALYVLAVSTGMRAAELLGLCWKDIDWDRHLVRVEQTLQRVDGEFQLRRTKSRAGRRKLPLAAYAQTKLREHLALQEEYRSLMGDDWGNPWDLVFTTEAGYPIDAWKARYEFRKVLAASHLPVKTRVHDLRHTFATLLIERGVHIMVVSQLLGHTSVEITLRVYGHVTPRMQGTAVSEINALLPAPGVAEAIAGELEAAQRTDSSVWKTLHTAVDQAILLLRTERAVAADEWAEFEAAQVALGELTDLIQSDWEDIDTTIEDIDDEESEEE